MKQTAVLFFAFLLLLSSCQKENNLLQDEENNSTNTLNNQKVIADIYESEIKLGKKINNPYSIANMTAAYNKLYNPNIEELPATDHYIRFLPKDLNEYNELLESGFTLFDTPLDHEIDKEGTYYQDPKFAPETIPWLYTVVSPETTLPPIHYELLDILHHPEDDYALEYEAYTAVGLKVPPYEDNGGGGGGGGGVDCRKPTGQILLDDSQFAAHDGVRNVQVMAKRYTKIRFTTTDDNGNYQFNSTFPEVHISVYFINNRAEIRGVRGTRIWQALEPVSHTSTLWSNCLANRDLIFWVPTASNSESAKVWTAATINNSVYETIDFATADNIFTPPMRLHIWISNMGSGFGSAPMFDKNKYTMLMLNYLGPLTLGIPTAGVWSFILALHPPDITFSYNSALFSDRVKNTLYHELGHSIHYKKVGNSYWYKEIQFTIVHNGYGTNGNAIDAGRPALVESWAELIGDTYTDRRYGINHSMSIPATEADRYTNRLEGSRFISTYIPEGWLYDLIDDNAVNAANGIPESAGVTDNVRGFTIEQIFDHMLPHVASPVALANRLRINELPNTPNTVANFNILFACY